LIGRELVQPQSLGKRLRLVDEHQVYGFPGYLACQAYGKEQASIARANNENAPFELVHVGSPFECRKGDQRVKAFVTFHKSSG
jgi:hypothetical protein